MTSVEPGDSQLSESTRINADRPWHQGLGPLCQAALDAATSNLPAETVVFFVARWCQKETGLFKPAIDEFDPGVLADVAARVINNLEADGVRVDRLIAGDSGVWTELRRALYGCAYARTGSAAPEYADEALQKIAIVLLTGTPPASAPGQLGEVIEGPRNEYIFTSPFPLWARTVVINLIVDERRRLAREREAPPARPAHKPPIIDRAILERARQELPALIDAIRRLPSVQRSVMVWSLMRTDVDPLVLSHLHELAPDLFVPVDRGGVGSDRDIASRLGTSARLVAANRSAARVKLADRDPYWKLLLDVLLPHRSNRPTREDNHDG
ncbi:MAG: sigma-70 family RNA polymerase sigma factor [Thermoleophilia bacterium]|nr:sigma-70 family RNA polymerase sigma factor [Thermoleophilia bacterium]